MAGLDNLSPFFQNPLFTETIKEVPVKAEYKGPRFLPVEETYDDTFHETAVVRQADMANIVSHEAELPLTDRDPMRAVSGEIADIGQAYVVSKREKRDLMHKGDQNRRKLAEKQLLGKARTIKENVDARIEWMRWQALSEGAITYNKDGVILSADFGVNMKKTAAVRWDDTVGNPQILKDYEAWVQEYVDKNGVLPSVYMTSLKVIRAVMNDDDVRKAVTGLSDKIIKLSELNEFLVDRQLPPMEAYDQTVTYRDVNNDGVRTTLRLLNEKKGVFLRDGGEIGSQLMGPTVENNMEPGYFARTVTLDLPLRDVIQVGAASFPKILTPDLIGITTVLA